MSGLTHQQARVLAFIRQFIAAKGFSPSYDEIGDELNMSKTFVCNVVHCLEERGAIRRIPAKTRSIEIVEPRQVELSPEVYALMQAYARDNSTSVKTATNEALRQWLGATA